MLAFESVKALDPGPKFRDREKEKVWHMNEATWILLHWNTMLLIYCIAFGTWWWKEKQEKCEHFVEKCVFCVMCVCEWMGEWVICVHISMAWWWLRNCELKLCKHTTSSSFVLNLNQFSVFDLIPFIHRHGLWLPLIV